jgi:hypothetical protein
VPANASAYCYPNEDQEVAEVRLSLTRSGDTLTGTFTSLSYSVPVTGRIDGTTVTLSGEALSPASGGSGLTRLSSWKGVLDEFGRMTGTFQFHFAFPSDAPTIGESATAELSQVLKVS